MLQILFKHAAKSSTVTINGKTRPTRLYDDSYKAPNHVLSFGYSCVQGSRTSLPGIQQGMMGLNIANEYPNSHVNTLRTPVWTRLLDMVGRECMFDLLLRRCVFMPLGPETKRNYYQLSGMNFNPTAHRPVHLKRTASDGICAYNINIPLLPYSLSSS